MYKIAVPIMAKTYLRSKKEDILKHLNTLGAKRVFIDIPTYLTDEKKKAEKFALAKEMVDFFHENGYEVGAWYWTFWTGPDNSYAKMTGVLGDVDENFACPSDEAFRKFAGDYIKEVAALGFDLIMYDDDFRYGFLKNGMIGCVCENHRRKMEELLGEKVTDEIISEYLLKGEKNKYRTAWLDANKYFMELFASDMRKALDEVSPETRLGFCACLTTWDFDGSDPADLCKILAGNTKPYLRLSSAPYWAAKNSWGVRTGDALEIARMESVWMKDKGIEIFSEGDVYPRPRWNIPASYLEAFDTALRADNNTDGMLKYAIDYTSSCNYEMGYIENHIKNEELYKEIEKAFAGKESTGVRVYEFTHKAYDMTVNKATEGMYETSHTLLSPAPRMMSANTIPTTYEGDGICAVAFGENARHLDLSTLKNGLITDGEGARILMTRGVDMGILSVGEDVNTGEEYFPYEDEYTCIAGEPCGGKNPTAKKYDLAPGCDIRSYYIDEQESKIPASYTYENKDGMKFYVFLSDMGFVPDTFYRQYTKRRELFYAVKYISGKDLPARLDSNPDMYMIAKEKDGELSIGIWNFSFDIAFAPKVELSKEYSEIEYINTNGTKSGTTVTLSDIPPFGFAGFSVK
ncbi:MAG: hypothetical protein Q4B31_00965 [Clostridia bacterium]|nr:hypothetical protein [Clostridia bacterium]